ncbi:Ycf48-like protein [Rubripirellula amarantea]|uniref:Ycf48-like protein n=1 Tax=Rubripirellula amarantea TaxID=2527999 RepID=A0A5C5WW48_9BACT|nr:YCF48-related protein [Rubripirellula amarantea]TWT54361.1 Ycf48-like protein [Rubripirellula amarantea]
MDELKKTIVIIAVLACGCWVMGPASAVDPVSFPGYSACDAMREDSSLHAVDFVTPEQGLAVGDRGLILATGDAGQTWTLAPSPVECTLEDVVWLSTKQAIAVGGGYDPITRISRGTVLRTNNGGATWQSIPRLDLPKLRHIEKQDDGSLLAVGDWSHGSLSSKFQSHDRGLNWQDANRGSPRKVEMSLAKDTSDDLARWNALTRSSSPIRDACRVDATTLCAVGDHGTILLSRDNGQVWKPVRGEDRHAAILFISSTADQVPWSIVGSEALQWRNRVAVLLADEHWSAAPPDEEVSPRELAHQTAIMLGASGVDVMTPEGSSSIEIEASRWIAIHRPDVVVIDESLPQDVNDAFFTAATGAGVYRVLKTSWGQRGAAMLHRNAILTQVGATASDLTSDAFQWIDPMNRHGRFDEDRSVILSRVYESGSASIGGGGQTIAHGLPRSQGARLIAPARVASRHRLQTIQARLRQSNYLLGHIEKVRDENRFKEMLGMLLDQTAKEDQLRMAWSVFLHAEDSPAVESIALACLTERFGKLSVSRWAEKRLEITSRSAEMSKLASMSLIAKAIDTSDATSSNSVVVSPFQNLDAPSPAFQQASAVIPAQFNGSEVVQAQAFENKTNTSGVADVDLQFNFHPAILLSGTHRKRDDTAVPIRLGVAAAAREPASAERQRIMQNGTPRWAELLRGSINKQVIAAQTSIRPRLDGILDDDCWANEKVSVNGIGVFASYDRDYVYLALGCQSDSLGPDPQPQTAHARDQPLAAVDRIRVRLDTDRDLWTSHELEFTDAGRTRDTINGNSAWQPTWYVASHREGNVLVFEVAIKRQDLKSDPIRREESWYLSTDVLAAHQDSVSLMFPDPNEWLQVTFE